MNSSKEYSMQPQVSRIYDGKKFLVLKPQFHVSAYPLGWSTRLQFWSPVLIPYDKSFAEEFGKNYERLKHKILENEQTSIDEFAVCHALLETKQVVPEDPRSAILRMYTPWVMDEPLTGKSFLFDNQEMPGLYDVRLSHSIIPEKVGEQWMIPTIEHVDVSGYVLFDANISEEQKYSSWVGASLLNAMFYGKHQNPFVTFPGITDSLIGVHVDYPTKRRMHHTRRALRRLMRLAKEDEDILQEAAETFMIAEQYFGTPDFKLLEKELSDITDWIYAHTQKSTKLDRYINK